MTPPTSAEPSPTQLTTCVPFPLSSSTTDSPLSITASIISILTFALGLFASYIALQSATRGAPREIARLVADLRTTQHEINRVAGYIFDDVHTELIPPVLQRDPPGYDEDGGRVGEGVVRRQRQREQKQGATAGAAADERGATIRIDTNHGLDELYAETQILLGNCVRLFYEADDMLKRSLSSTGSRDDDYDDNGSHHWRWWWWWWWSNLDGIRRRIIYVMNRRHEVAEKMQRLEDQKAKLARVQMDLFMRKSVQQDLLLRRIAERLG